MAECKVIGGVRGTARLDPGCMIRFSTLEARQKASFPATEEQGLQ